MKQKSPKHPSWSFSWSSASPPESLELTIDTSKGSKNLENSVCWRGRQAATPVFPFAWVQPVILNIAQVESYWESAHNIALGREGPTRSYSSNPWLLPLDQAAPSPTQPGLEHSYERQEESLKGKKPWLKWFFYHVNLRQFPPITIKYSSLTVWARGTGCNENLKIVIVTMFLQSSDRSCADTQPSQQ